MKISTASNTITHSEGLPTSVAVGMRRNRTAFSELQLDELEKRVILFLIGTKKGLCLILVGQIKPRQTTTVTAI